jgi:hypothetical protein
MEAIKRLKTELMEDLIEHPVGKDDSGGLGKLQGRIQSCDEIYGLEVLRFLDQRGDEDEQENESNSLS